jgi:hypothetical protein
VSSEPGSLARQTHQEWSVCWSTWDSPLQRLKLQPRHMELWMLLTAEQDSILPPTWCLSDCRTRLDSASTVSRVCPSCRRLVRSTAIYRALGRSRSLSCFSLWQIAWVAVLWWKWFVYQNCSEDIQGYLLLLMEPIRFL